jgi:hypothetical protein
VVPGLLERETTTVNPRTRGTCRSRLLAVPAIPLTQLSGRLNFFTIMVVSPAAAMCSTAFSVPLERWGRP